MEIYTALNGAKWLIFEEYKILNYKKQKGERFDVSAKGFLGISPDFLVNGEFSQEYYCTCLLETVVQLSPNQLSKFLDYQCKQFERPKSWLNHLDMLAQVNKHTDLMREYYEEFNLITALVSKKLALLTGQSDDLNQQFVCEPSVSYDNDPRFQIEKVKEELELIPTLKKRRFFLLRRLVDFAQLPKPVKDTGFDAALHLELTFMEEHKELIEQEIIDKAKKNGKKTEISRRIVYKEHPKLLVDFFKQILLTKDSNGKLFFNCKNVWLAEIICSCFCDKNGEAFSFNSIKTYIDNKSLGWKGKSWKIDISLKEEIDKKDSNK